MNKCIFIFEAFSLYTPYIPPINTPSLNIMGKYICGYIYKIIALS